MSTTHQPNQRGFASYTLDAQQKGSLLAKIRLRPIRRGRSGALPRVIELVATPGSKTEHR